MVKVGWLKMLDLLGVPERVDAKVAGELGCEVNDG